MKRKKEGRDGGRGKNSLYLLTKLTQWILPGEHWIDCYGILICAEFLVEIPNKPLKCFACMEEL